VIRHSDPDLEMDQDIRTN